MSSFNCTTFVHVFIFSREGILLHKRPLRCSLICNGISNALQSALVGEIPELSKYRSTIEQLLNSDGKIRYPRDGIITDMIHQIFSCMEGAPEEDKLHVLLKRKIAAKNR